MITGGFSYFNKTATKRLPWSCRLRWRCDIHKLAQAKHAPQVENKEGQDDQDDQDDSINLASSKFVASTSSLLILMVQGVSYQPRLSNFPLGSNRGQPGYAAVVEILDVPKPVDGHAGWTWG